MHRAAGKARSNWGPEISPIKWPLIGGFVKVMSAESCPRHEVLEIDPATRQEKPVLAFLEMSQSGRRKPNVNAANLTAKY